MIKDIMLILEKDKNIKVMTVKKNSYDDIYFLAELHRMTNGIDITEEKKGSMIKVRKYNKENISEIRDDFNLYDVSEFYYAKKDKVYTVTRDDVDNSDSIEELEKVKKDDFLYKILLDPRSGITSVNIYDKIIDDYFNVDLAEKDKYRDIITKKIDNVYIKSSLSPMYSILSYQDSYDLFLFKSCYNAETISNIIFNINEIYYDLSVMLAEEDGYLSNFDSIELLEDLGVVESLEYSHHVES